MAMERFKNTLRSLKATSEKPRRPRLLTVVEQAAAMEVLHDYFVSTEAVQKIDCSAHSLNDGERQERKKLYAVDEAAGKKLDDHIRKRGRREEGNTESENERLSQSRQAKRRIRDLENHIEADVKESMPEKEIEEDKK